MCCDTPRYAVSVFEGMANCNLPLFANPHETPRPYFTEQFAPQCDSRMLSSTVVQVVYATEIMP